MQSVDVVHNGKLHTSPVRTPRVIVNDSGDPGYTNNLLVGTPCTGNVRVEFVAARYAQQIPLNWSLAAQMQVMSGYMPLRYQVADAQNLILAQAIKLDMEWVAFLEHDVVIQPDTFVRWNRYMREAKCPVVSGVYFSRAYPSEPMVFRGMGTGAYLDWKFGDKIWCDGVPTGLLLIHMGLIRTMWEDSERYTLNGIETRRVFVTPRDSYYNPDTGMLNMATGTSDLEWCKRVISGRYLYKSGWGAFADEHPEYPYLVDTDMFAWHINPDGTHFPDKATFAEFERD